MKKITRTSIALALLLSVSSSQAGIFSYIDDFFGGIARGAGNQIGAELTQGFATKYKKEILIGIGALVGIYVLRKFYLTGSKKVRKKPHIVYVRPKKRNKKSIANSLKTTAALATSLYSFAANYLPVPTK